MNECHCSNVCSYYLCLDNSSSLLAGFIADRPAPLHIPYPIHCTHWCQGYKFRRQIWRCGVTPLLNTSQWIPSPHRQQEKNPNSLAEPTWWTPVIWPPPPHSIYTKPVTVPRGSHLPSPLSSSSSGSPSLERPLSAPSTWQNCHYLFSCGNELSSWMQGLPGSVR